MVTNANYGLITIDYGPTQGKFTASHGANYVTMVTYTNARNVKLRHTIGFIAN